MDHESPAVSGPEIDEVTEVTDAARVPTDVPWLPPGRLVELPGRGQTFVRDSGGPPGAPTVLLLHGWAVTADLNYFPAYPELAERYRVVAMDHRGHGRGIPAPRGQVRLSQCADDAAALLEELGIDRATVVGYSMGGAVAQLVWRRHPDRVRALVLASTARNFQAGPLSDLSYRLYTPMSHLARTLSGPAESVVGWRVNRRVADGDRSEWMRAELLQADPSALLSSMRSIGRFSSNRWAAEVDVPTAVVITTKDRTVPPRAQRRLADAIPDATRSEVEGPHDSIVSRPDAYVPVLIAAIDRVTEDPGQPR